MIFKPKTTSVMSKVKVVTGFPRMRGGELVVFASTIVAGMTDNENFPNPTPALADVKAAAMAYENALAATLMGGIVITAEKNARRKELEKLLFDLSLYVQLNCKNDLSILLSSGYHARKPKTSVGMLEKPSYFTVEYGPYPGSIKRSLKKIKGAGSYQYEYAAAPVDNTTQWAKQVATRRTKVIEGLTSGREYAFRVTAIGTDPTRVYSDVISRLAV
jgi:hypothetical protein